MILVECFSRKKGRRGRKKAFLPCIAGVALAVNPVQAALFELGAKIRA